MSKNKKAFTLIELLVAMAIIGVLIGLSIFGLSAAQRAQRDTERRAALQDMNIGVQAYYEKYGIYPVAFEIKDVNNVIFCSQTDCTVATAKSVSVPIKGAATAVAANYGAAAAANTIAAATSALANTTTTATAYCLVNQVVYPAGGTPGFALCGALESGVFYCLGTGVVKGNSIASCGGTAVSW
jgi:prepilin-type N-terminal cleavage/methylation domain-containing protein